MKTLVKTLSKVFVALFAVWALAGCPAGGGEEGKPVLSAEIKQDNNAVTSSAFEIEEGKDLILSVHGKTGGTPTWYEWEILNNSNAGNYLSISGEDTQTVTITGISDSQNNAVTIRAYAGNQDGSAYVDISVKVISETIVPGMLYLAVGSGGTGTWNSNTLTIKDNDNLTLTVIGTVDGAPVTLTGVEWEVTGTVNIVTIVKATGVVTVVKTGTTQIKVSAEAVEATAPGSKIITLVVKNSIELLYEWHYADNPITNLTTSGQKWEHPDYTDFMKQKDDLQVKSLRSFGAGVNLEGAIRINNSSRLSIGQFQNTTTAATDNPITNNLGGEIDLFRKKVRLTLVYKDAVAESGRIPLRVFVNQNTTGQANSMFGTGDPAPCSLITYSTVDALVSANPGNTADVGILIINIDTTQTGTQPGGALFGHDNEAGLAKAFICLLSQAGNSVTTNGITFTDIKLEYLGGEETLDPISLTIQDESNNPIPSGGITIVKPVTTQTLKAETTLSGVDITWTSANPGIASVSPGTGSTVTITGGTVGSTTITVKAEKAGYFPAEKTFTVSFSESATGSNILWEWAIATDSWTSINANTNSTLKTLDGAAVKVRNWGAAALSSYTGPTGDDRKGIVMGTTGAHRFLIGSNSNTNSDGATWDNTAQFDFSAGTLGSKKIKISVVYDVLTNGSATEANHQLRILINNNTVTSAGSIHSFDSTSSKWYLAQESIYGPTKIDGGPYTLTGTFDPTKAALTGTPAGGGTLADVLKNSYVAIGMMANAGTVLISEIKIEYVD